jgi:hypothetical protein
MPVNKEICFAFDLSDLGPKTITPPWQSFDELDAIRIQDLSEARDRLREIPFFDERFIPY